MKTVGHILLSAMAVGDKRRTIELYGNNIANYPHAKASKGFYEAKELQKECKSVSAELMNLESHSTMFPTKIDGKTASNLVEAYRLIAERYRVYYKLGDTE